MQGIKRHRVLGTGDDDDDANEDTFVQYVAPGTIYEFIVSQLHGSVSML